MITINFETCRRKFKPGKIKFLLIAEAPPKKESRRFFYYEKVKTQDSLFLEIMKVIYPLETLVTKKVREQKHSFLTRFQNDGFYLIDAVEKPLENPKKDNKMKKIKESLHALSEKIKGLISKDTKIILISTTVYNACFNSLKVEGFNIINKEAIPFLGSGQQKRFKEKFSELLQEYKVIK